MHTSSRSTHDMDRTATLSFFVSWTLASQLYQLFPDPGNRCADRLPVHRLWAAKLRSHVQPLHKCGVGLRTGTAVLHDPRRDGIRFAVWRVPKCRNGCRNGRIWDGRLGRVRRWRSHAIRTVCFVCFSGFVVRPIHETRTSRSLSGFYGGFRLRLTLWLRRVQRIRQLSRNGRPGRRVR